MRLVSILGLMAAALIGALALVRRHLGIGNRREVPGGILIANAAGYDRQSRLLGGFYDGIARDITAVAPTAGRVLDVGCGPGQLSIRLARDHGLDVTGVDLDPAMVDLARANAASGVADGTIQFEVGDVAELPFQDGSFDVVVSSMSLHHWAHPQAGLAEIDRVIRPGGRALIWDFRPGRIPLHPRMPDPVEALEGGPLEVLDARPWRWPWRFSLTRRIELARSTEPPATSV